MREEGWAQESRVSLLLPGQLLLYLVSKGLVKAERLKDLVTLKPWQTSSSLAVSFLYDFALFSLLFCSLLICFMCLCVSVWTCMPQHTCGGQGTAFGRGFSHHMGSGDHIL